MDKIVERGEQQIVLEPLKQYLEREGIPSHIRYEWIGYRGAHGDAVLMVEDDLYEKAMAALNEIDRSEFDDGEVLRDSLGMTYKEKKALIDRAGTYLVRGTLVFLVLALLYGLIKYPPFSH